MNCCPNTKRSLVFAVTGLWTAAAVFALVFGVLLPEGVWSDYESGNCDGYCENHHRCPDDMADRPVVQQPANAWTNLFYLFAGLLVVGRRVHLGSVTLLLATTYLCIGSFVYHASVTKAWQIADVAGMYTVIVALIGHGVHALFGMRWGWIAPVVVALAVLFTCFKDDMDSVGLRSKVFVIVSAAVLIGLVITLLAARIVQICDPKRIDILRAVFAAAVPGVLFAAAVVCRTLDVNRTWCDPEHFVQGHAVWHTLTAAVVYFLWQFFDYDLPKEEEVLDLDENRQPKSASSTEHKNDDDGFFLNDECVQSVPENAKNKEVGNITSAIENLV